MDARSIGKALPEPIPKKRATIKVPFETYLSLEQFCEAHCLYASSAAQVAIETAIADPKFFMQAIEEFRNRGRLS